MKEHPGKLLSHVLSDVPLDPSDLQPGSRVMLEELPAGFGMFPSKEGALSFGTSLLESCAYAVMGKALDGTVVFWNRAAEALYGYRAEEILAKNVAVLVPTDRAEEVRIALAQVREGITVHLKTARFRKDGERIQVFVTISPIHAPGGALIGACTITHDLGEIDSYVEDVRESERKSSQVQGLMDVVGMNAPVGLGYTDRDFRIVYMNENLAAINGASVEQLLGRTVEEAVPAIWPKVEAVYRKVLEEDVSVVNLEVEGELVSQPGQRRHWLCSYYPLHHGGEVSGVGIIVVDVTERWQADQSRLGMVDDIVNMLAATVEIRDPYTSGHQHRVAELARAIAKEMALSEDTAKGISVAASIHDIGKVGVPVEILVKPGRLNAPEFELIKLHSHFGYEMLKGITFPWPVAEMVLQHHERLDGSGYPRGLEGEKIILGAKILAVADVVEAMSAHRPYHSSLGIDAAIEEICRGRGTLYEPQVVDALLRLQKEGHVLEETTSAPAK